MGRPWSRRAAAPPCRGSAGEALAGVVAQDAYAAADAVALVDVGLGPEPVVDGIDAALPGCIGAPAAAVNAVLDVPRPLGVSDLQIPLTPQRVWRAIREAAPTA